MTTAVTLKLRVVPGAKRDEIAGWHGDAIRVRCQAPALEGRANDAVTQLLADLLGVKRSSVILVQGLKSRDKVVIVHGIATEAAYARLGLDQPQS